LFQEIMSKFLPVKLKRWVFFALIFSLICAGMMIGAMAWNVRTLNLRVRSLKLPEEALPSSVSRLLIFAPHCDDETLGCGGIIQKALRAGSAIQITLMTNGDGFSYAARRAFKEIRVSPEDYVRLAYERQGETLAALKALGLPGSDVFFLGYPDGGLAALWNDYFSPDRLYTSRFTKHDHAPYKNAFRSQAPYCGSSVLKDVKEVIRRFGPTDIFIPHPNDNHGDHWATYAFVTAALEEIDLADTLKLHTYLVHRGDWPVPQGLHPQEPLAPPARLAHLDTRWYVLPLSRQEIRVKQKAVCAYQSQMAVIGRFLTSFIRANELFGVFPDAIAPKIEPGHIRVDGRIEDWKDFAPVLMDPVRDTMATELEGHADFQDVWALHSPGALYVRLDLRKPFSRGVHYFLRLHTLEPRPRIFNLRLDQPQKLASQGILMATQGGHAELAIPLELLGDRFRSGQSRAIFLELDARIWGLQVDKTAWKVVRLG